MTQDTITIKAYQTKCEFCDKLFIGLKPDIAETKRNEHMYNDCVVLRCICIAKDLEYPINQNKRKS